MSDMISRQAAIDAAEKESQVDGAYGYMDTKSIVDLLNDLPSAQPEPCEDAVSRQAVINIINKPVIIKAKEQIEALPSVQPEIIHCKDCINWDTTWTNDCTPNYHYCPLIDGVRKDNFYCADAERRTDG